MKGHGDRDLVDRHVLIVEDEFYIADDLAHSLRALGARVLGPVSTPPAALALIEEASRLDVAILDINLEGLEVFPVADALEARGVPFVFATGYDSASVPERYLEVPLWEKPFDPGLLGRALAALAGQRPNSSRSPVDTAPTMFPPRRG